MKTLFILSSLLLSTGAFAAQKIECAQDDGKVVATLHRVLAHKPNEVLYKIDADEAITSGFFTVEDRVIGLEKKANADKLSDWDGNSGVEISFRKGFLAAEEGVTSRAFLHTYYHDGEDDDVKTPLLCKVVM